MKNRGQGAANELFVYSVVASIRRRKYLILVPTLVFAAAAAFYSLRLSSIYRSEALLRAEPMVTVRDFVDATGAAHATHVLNVDESFRSIREVVLGEEILTKIIREFGLYDLVNGRVTEATLLETKKRIVIRMDGVEEMRRNDPRFVSFWVGFEGSDRKQVTAVANRLADLFIKEASDARERRIQDIVGFIQAEMAPLQKKLDVQSEKIKQYKQGASDSLPEHATSNLRLLEGLQTQYLAKTESIAKDEARHSAIVLELRELEKQGALETITPVEERSDIGKKLDDLRMQYRQMQARYAPDHPELKRVKTEIAAVEQLVPRQSTTPRAEHSPFYLRHVQLKSELEELERRAQSYRKEQQDLGKQMVAYRSRVDIAPTRESELAEMVRDYSATQLQYGEMLERQQNARLAEHFEKMSSEIVFRVIDPARLPSQPVSPLRLRIILFGALAGLGFGIALAFVVDQMDSSFSSIDDYQRTCELPILAAIPSIGRRFFSHRHPNGTDADPRVVMMSDPYSIPAEQYRILATKLLARNGGPSHAVAITSSTGGEGKTLTAINLALALSGMPNRNVLLIDADLRRPRVQEYIGQRSQPEKGFADLLSNLGEVELDRYVRTIGDLHFIPGIVSREDPTKLLASQAAREILQMLRTKFQFIILDTPPIVPIADSIILSSLADEVLLVVRAGNTPRELFQHAVEHLGAANLRGVVLNDVDFQHSRYAHAYRYYRKNFGAQPQQH